MMYLRYPASLFSLAVLSLGLTTVSCSSRGGNGSTADSAERTATVAAKSLHRLDFPQPPAILTTDSARLDYVVSHYWDSFDRGDTTWIADTAALEQAFANWTGVLRYLSEPQAAETITAFFRSTEVCPAVRDRLLEVAERYFYDPNSPLRSEELYIPVLEYAIASPGIDEVYKIRPRTQFEMVMRNRPGNLAADFAYTTSDGRVRRLSSLHGDYTLLLFYNPGCPDCARVEEFIASSQALAPLIESGTLKMLAVYTEDDLDTWRKHIPYLPTNWTVAYDKGCRIAEQELYDLRAIPCLYLLDKQKRVLLKDAPVEQIEAWIAASQKQEAQR